MEIYTIGYAGKEIDDFISHLKKYNITALVDVRTLPYSRMFREYNREDLKEKLNENKIHYIYMGLEFGPRSTDEKDYNSSGQVQFKKLQEKEIFKKGVQRVLEGLNKNMNISLMCAEKNACTCHRSLLVGHFLEINKRIKVKHIDFLGSYEEHMEMIEKEAVKMGIKEDFFTSKEDAVKQTYEKLSLKYAYKKN